MVLMNVKSQWKESLREKETIPTTKRECGMSDPHVINVILLIHRRLLTRTGGRGCRRGLGGGRRGLLCVCRKMITLSFDQNEERQVETGTVSCRKIAMDSVIPTSTWTCKLSLDAYYDRRP